MSDTYTHELRTYDTGCSPEDQWKKCAEELAEVLAAARAYEPYRAKWDRVARNLPPNAFEAATREHRRLLAGEVADCHMALDNLARACGLTPGDMGDADAAVRRKLMGRGCYGGTQALPR